MLSLTGLIIVIFYGFCDANLRYAVIFPSEVYSKQSELVCLHMVGMVGETSVQLVLQKATSNITLFESNLQENTYFHCIPFQVPEPSDGNEEVATIHAAINHAGNSIYKKSKLLLKGKRAATFIQTDKAIYKPGQTVKFRVVSLDENFQPGKNQLSAVKLQDPEKNLIGQWLNVSLSQGIAELSLPLSSEPLLGEYSIHVKDKVHTFSVEEYVLPKFEVTLHFSKAVVITDEKCTLQLCGRYTYGKPVKGNYKIQVCRSKVPYYYTPSPDVPCVDFTGELDISGCSTVQVPLDTFHLHRRRLQMKLLGTATITEEGTGIELSTTTDTSILDENIKVNIFGSDTTYKPGIPMRIQVKVSDASDTVIPGKQVLLTYNSKLDTIVKTLVTGPDGIASFNIDDTTDWKGSVSFTATVNQTDYTPPDQSDSKVPSNVFAHLKLSPFRSHISSFIKIHSPGAILPCDGQQEVKVDYIIKQKELQEGGSHLHLHYLVITRFSIKYSGQLEIPIRSIDKDERGDVVLKLPLTADMAPTFSILGYILFPNQDAVADSVQFNMEKCFRNKVSVKFLPGEVLPKSDVSLQVEAAPGSLCGLRVVDKSVVLMKPDNELTATKVFDLFPISSSHTYNRQVEDETKCKSRSSYYFRYKGRRDRNKGDVCTYFENLSLKIMTSANIQSARIGGSPKKGRAFMRKPRPGGFEFAVLYTELEDLDEEDYVLIETSNIIPVKKQKSVIRHYFPETWIWKLEAVGDSGIGILHDTAPDTITDWHGGAFCMGPGGFGLASPVPFRVFQPFFVDITLPYSVIRGETFTLKSTVFNYLKQCIKVRTTLIPSAELEERPCDDCQYSSCLCVDESKTFYWNLKASKLGHVNVTVTTEALDTQDLCQNEVPIVPKQGSIDTVVKPLLVQPGGLMEEKSYSALLCSRGEDDSKVEEISLKIPENILKDSERANIVVIGDLMGTAMQNLDRLLAMPYGCGEQNMVLFAPNIFILQYLEKTHQLNSEIKNKATTFLESGYQRELTYKRDDGSYSAFGKSDSSGNTWLTAFVVKSFSKARPYIFIDENHLKHSFSWLKENQQVNGCFGSVGRLFNNAMKGGVTDEVSLSTYVTIALLEAGVLIEDPMVRDAVSCLRTAAETVTNVYSQALLAYAFTLSGDTELREAMMDKLEAQVVRRNREQHWERLSKPQSEDSYWSRAPSAEVEMTSYVLLAVLSGPTQDLVKGSEIVNWLSKQQNPYGGFSSTQDTVVALQALAKYAEATFSDKGDVTVTVSSKTEFMKQFHVNNNNRLLLQSTSLPTVPGEYTVTSSGSGCVYVQTVLRYNVPPPRQEETFAIKVEVQSNECAEESMTKLELTITARYTGSRQKSNMVVIDVKMLSGYIPLKSSVRKLEENLIKRSDIQMDMVTLYLEELEQDSINLSFFIEQDIKVKDLKPAIVKIYDYYETDEHAVTEYNSPCSGEDKSNTNQGTESKN
ncbi:alpha-2-macroglobulin-like [Bufo gargarizans]|uniref:alpha-2-macroglobulin-like n=1 Tax=Bufo gargarizans TaxID=30331 RepID=UPI001CF23DC5|nr:alpha-2-macroglobulin-like [Bufo gargarizans]